MPISLTSRDRPAVRYETLAAAMEAVLARYPEAVLSDVDFEADDTIWVWPSNAASQHARLRDAVCWLRQEE